MAPGPIPDISATTAAGAGGVTAAVGGVAEVTTGAVSKGLAVASGQLARVQEMLQSMDVTQAMEGLQQALQNVAGQSSATIVPEAVSHLPEVMP